MKCLLGVGRRCERGRDTGSFAQQSKLHSRTSLQLLGLVWMLQAERFKGKSQDHPGEQLYLLLLGNGLQSRNISRESGGSAGLPTLYDANQDINQTQQI